MSSDTPESTDGADPASDPLESSDRAAGAPGTADDPGLGTVPDDGDPGGPDPGDAELSDEELDSKWGLTEAEPMIGVGAPPVVAVLVTHDPGEWFEETLESLADQDYDSLSVLVIDNGSSEDPAGRIADVLPRAYVKRVEVDAGFSLAANEALGAVEGAAFYLFLHDDVRLASDAVTQMVAEAFRSTAGIIGPKLVDWDRSDRIMSVGYAVDPYGFRSSIADRGELDQSQHDQVREVFAVSDAAMLIRADLFDTLGGFTETLPFFGEDIDLCWRAHIAGASVFVCPSAVVGHRDRFAERRDAQHRERLELRHEARTMLSNYSAGRLLSVMPVVAMLSGIDLAGSVLLGRFGRAGDIISAWAWNLVKLPSLLAARSRVKKERRVPDSSYLELMRQGSSRLSSLVRVGDTDDSRLQAAARAGRGYFQDLSSTSRRTAAVASMIAAVLVVVGSRNLFAGSLPMLREFAPLGSGPRELFSEWFSAWRAPGFGEPAVAPGAVPFSGALSFVLLGSASLARRLIILVPLFLGVLGAWKLFAATGSSRARAGALLAYGLNPVALNALAEGRLQALVAYGVAPWVLRRLARGAAIEPFAVAPDPDSAAVPPRRLTIPRHSAGTALLLALVGAFSPLGAAVLVASCCLIAIVLWISGVARSAPGRMLVLTAVSSVFAAMLLSPWLIAALRHGDAASLLELWHSRAETPSAAMIITGSVGPVAVGFFGWGVVVAAGYSLLTGRSWRLGWAFAGWVLLLCSWIVAILAARNGFVGGAGLELLLMPAVLGLAVAVAMGALAFEHDVVGSDFGFAQFLSAVAVVALLVGLVPIAVAAAQGRWYLPEGGFDRSLSAVDEEDGFRTLWIGDPDVLPLSGWQLEDSDDLAIGTSVGLTPTISQQYRLDGGSSIASVGDAVEAALSGQTHRLGRVLAPAGIRYVVLVGSPAPQAFAPIEVDPSPSVVAAFREQLDLVEFETDPAITAFRVEGPWPLRSDITELELADDAGATWSDLAQLDVAVPPEALPDGGPGEFSGTVSDASKIAQAATADPGWSLRVGGSESERFALFGWQQQYLTDRAGPAELSWSTSVPLRLLQVGQLAVLVVLMVAAISRRSMVEVPRRPASGSDDGEPLIVVGPESQEPSGEQSSDRGGAEGRSL